jgi:hypothetical protein
MGLEKIMEYCILWSVADLKQRSISTSISSGSSKRGEPENETGCYILVFRRAGRPDRATKFKAPLVELTL